MVLWNRSAAKAEPLVARGAQWAATPAAAATGAELVIAMVADDPASRAVWLGPDGALGGMSPGAFAIECSTLTRGLILELDRQARAKVLRFIDCPVTGRPDAAAAGKLTLLVGAEPADLAAARPVLESFSETIRHFGPAGAGTAYKLMINLMGAVQIAALGEGLVMAERLGLDRVAVVEAIETSAAASRQVVFHARRMAERRFSDPTFTAELRHKDAAYGVALAREVGACVPLGETSVAWFDAANRLDPAGDEGRVIDAIEAKKARS